MSNENNTDLSLVDESKIIHLTDRRPSYTQPMDYAMAAVGNLNEPENNESKRNLTFDEKLNIASQLAGISKEQAISFCMIMKQL